jgi:hypothetical protein
VELADQVHPRLLSVGTNHDVRCWLYHDGQGRVIRTEAPPSFRASSLAGSKAISERGATAELGGTLDADGGAGPE